MVKKKVLLFSLHCLVQAFIKHSSEEGDLETVFWDVIFIILSMFIFLWRKYLFLSLYFIIYNIHNIWNICNIVNTVWTNTQKINQSALNRIEALNRGQLRNARNLLCQCSQNEYWNRSPLFYLEVNVFLLFCCSVWTPFPINPFNSL